MKYRIKISAAANILPDQIENQPTQYARALRRADDFIKLAVAGAQTVISTGGLNNTEPEKTGIFVATSYGPLETNFTCLNAIIKEGEGQISPMMFSHSVFNSAAGYIARILNIQGPALTLTSYIWPFFSALEQAVDSLLSQRISQALVIGVDTYDVLLEDTYKRSLSMPIPWKPKAAAWLLTRSDSEEGIQEREKKFLFLSGVDFEEKNCQPMLYLSRKGESWQKSSGEKGNCTEPMSYLKILTDFAAKTTKPEKVIWEFEAPFGNAALSFEG
jgi:hypothetical protein